MVAPLKTYIRSYTVTRAFGSISKNLRATKTWKVVQGVG